MMSVVGYSISLLKKVFVLSKRHTMKRAEMVRSCLRDLAHGEPSSVEGLLDYLIIDCGIPRERVCEIAERYFRLPRETALATVGLLRPQYILE